MVQVITGSARLARLKSLRVELDAEIAAEESRLARLERLRQRAAKPRPKPVPPPLPAGDVSPADIRAWALSVGLPVADRARIPTHIRAAYVEAHDPANQV